MININLILGYSHNALMLGTCAKWYQIPQNAEKTTNLIIMQMFLFF